jgi:hypothetical protein
MGAVYENMYLQKIVLSENESRARLIASYCEDSPANEVWKLKEEIICEEINLDTVHAGFIGGMFIHVDE